MKFLSLIDCLFIHQSMYAYVSIYFSSSILNIIMPVVLKRKCLTVFYLGHRKEYVCFDQVFEIGTSKVDLQKYFYFVIIPTQCFYRFFRDFDWSVSKIKLFYTSIKAHA